MARSIELDSRPAHAPSFRETAVRGIAYQGAISLYQLVVPAVISRQYGSHTLGVWFTCYAALGLGVTFNMGMPGALLSLVDGRVSGDPVANARRSIGALMLTGRVSVALLVLAVVALGIPLGDWLRLDSSDGSANVLASVFIAATALMLLANLAQPLYLALFRGHEAYRLATAVHVLALPCVIGIASLKPPFWLLAALVLSPPIVAGFGLWWLSVHRRLLEFGTETPTSDNASRRELLAVGGTFLTLDVIMAMILRTPELMLSFSHGFVEAGRFSVFQRSPLLLNAVLTAVLQPLWPLLARAARESDDRSATRYIRRALHGTMILWVGFAVAVIPFGEALIKYWLGAAVVVSHRTLLLSTVFALAQSLQYWTALALVGMGARRAYLRISFAMVASYFLCSWHFTQHLGADGAYLSLLIAFGPVGTTLGAFACAARLRGIRACVKRG